MSTCPEVDDVQNPPHAPRPASTHINQEVLTWL